MEKQPLPSSLGLIIKHEKEAKQREIEKEKANTENRIKTLETEISQIKKALEYLGVEYKDGFMIVKEQPKKKFLGLF